ncbi:MAG: uncharacterized protein QOH26_1087 [Actinomycetota bacterium]|nr:uncharacterized protein [Actinomycetota bacterium]
MEIKNEFIVPAPPEETWELLLDVERIVPCVAGAELTEVVDDSHWKGKMSVKLGPIRLSFAGEVELEERDVASRRVSLRAKGKETRGKGSAQATVVSVLEAYEQGTRVSISTDLKLAGAVAQYGRGMIEDVSSRMIDDFARCVASKLEIVPAQPGVSAGDPASQPQMQSPPTAAPPLKGGRLLLGALFRAFTRFLKRIFGRRTT